jgi:hypothetical protein
MGMEPETSALEMATGPVKGKAAATETVVVRAMLWESRSATK